MASQLNRCVSAWVTGQTNPLVRDVAKLEPAIPSEVEHIDREAPPPPHLSDVVEARAPYDFVEVRIGLWAVRDHDAAATCEGNPNVIEHGADNGTVGDDVLPLLPVEQVRLPYQVRLEHHGVTRPDELTERVPGRGAEACLVQAKEVERAAHRSVRMVGVLARAWCFWVGLARVKRAGGGIGGLAAVDSYEVAAWGIAHGRNRADGESGSSAIGTR